MIQDARESFTDWQGSLKTHPVRWGSALFLAFAVGVFLIGPTMAYMQKPPTITVVADRPVTTLVNDRSALLGIEVDRSKRPVCQGALTRVLWRWKPGTHNSVREIVWHFSFDAAGDPFPNDMKFQLDLTFPEWLLKVPGLHYTSFYKRQCSVWSYWFPDVNRVATDISLPAEPLSAALQ